MTEYVPFVIFGLTLGSVYGLAAMGLVLTYKTSGIFNFGHGAIGAASAYVFYELHQKQGLAWPIAAVLAVLVFGAVLGLGMERLSRALAPAPTIYKIVATIALLLIIRSAAILIYGPEFLVMDSFLPQKTAFTLSGVAVSQEKVIVFGLGLVAAVALFVFFRSSRAGIEMRAVVQSPALLDLTGRSPVAVRRRAWLVGSWFASASGVLFASQQQQLDATLLSLLVVQAFGAAAVGRFTSLPVVYVGGLAIGLVQQVASKQFASVDALQGVDYNIPFFVLFAVLLVIPRHKLVDVSSASPSLRKAASRIPRGVSAALAVAALGIALLIPHIVGTKLPLWLNAASQVCLFLALGLLVRSSGQISLCHVGLAAVGAAGFGHAVGSVPWGVAVLVGGLVAVPVGALIAIPAIRLSGLFLALATLGFGILLSQFFYSKSYMFGLQSLDSARPTGLGLDSDTGYYYLLVGVAVSAMVLVFWLERSRLGRLLRGTGDSTTAMATLGLDVNITKVIAFCLSAFLAGISGALYAGQFASVSGDSFNYVQSLVILAVIVTAGRSTLSAAVLGPVLLYVVPGYVDNERAPEVLQLLFGLVAVGVAVWSSGEPGAALRNAVAAAKKRRPTTYSARHPIAPRPAHANATLGVGTRSTSSV